jgi:hypothetical protein
LLFLEKLPVQFISHIKPPHLQRRLKGAMPVPLTLPRFLQINGLTAIDLAWRSGAMSESWETGML